MAWRSRVSVWIACAAWLQAEVCSCLLYVAVIAQASLVGVAIIAAIHQRLDVIDYGSLCDDAAHEAGLAQPAVAVHDSRPIFYCCSASLAFDYLHDVSSQSV
jgi:hypothetical protein